MNTCGDACGHDHAAAHGVHASLDHTHAPDPAAQLRPRRAILTKDDLERFQTSQAFADYVGFVEALSGSVRNVTLRTDVPVSAPVAALLAVLDRLDSWVADLPPDDNTKSRFGNPAFQRWFDRLEANADDLAASVLAAAAGADHPSLRPADPDAGAGAGARSPAQIEVATYLLNSFGNRKRIDYGTGHEAHFIAALLCLDKLGVVAKEDYPALVLRVFWRYIDVMRSLQCSYWLEPAGSHGVWGLDDYHFLPFLFGASQLADHKYLRPKSIHDADVLAEFSKDYMYLACIQFINSVKTASLRWHSPMLDDISGVKKWDKVCQGMLKMYKAEVLNKLPIMQHFLFGSLISFEGSVFDPALASEQHGHDHVHAFGQEHPTCCGMRIPSAIAAGLADKRSLVRPLPFD
ncbi:Serine/threonine-protein phosphatase 2A activator 2 [Polyrhizophydium stewartii]|uniref:Serine/threonine-protein phosphatase 2A activator n=1 Tax=Polyrhizophydium stewartii TaxID=2732419 RepID=A0ABR4N201_9FUNG|nr:Serine/threonine-protein phosphatase 2A activator 2 [Polyrhizophydium stewartii]